MFGVVACAATWDANKDGLRPIPPLTGRVTDLTGTLSAGERQALDAKLRDVGSAHHQPARGARSCRPLRRRRSSDYGIRVADAWKIGQKGEDNGAIFIVAKDDKRMRIEVGYGFEGVLTDVTSRRIIGENVAPLVLARASSPRASTPASIASWRWSTTASRCQPVGKTARKPRARRNIDFGTLFIVLLVAVPIVGGILRSIFGNLGGSLVGGGIAGVAAWFVAGSLLIAGVAGVVGVLHHPVLRASAGAAAGVPWAAAAWVVAVAAASAVAEVSPAAAAASAAAARRADGTESRR